MTNGLQAMIGPCRRRAIRNRWTRTTGYWHNLRKAMRLWCSGSTRAFQALRASSSLVSRSNSPENQRVP